MPTEHNENKTSSKDPWNGTVVQRIREGVYRSVSHLTLPSVRSSQHDENKAQERKPRAGGGGLSLRASARIPEKFPIQDCGSSQKRRIFLWLYLLRSYHSVYPSSKQSKHSYLFTASYTNIYQKKEKELRWVKQEKLFYRCKNLLWTMITKIWTTVEIKKRRITKGIKQNRAIENSIYRMSWFWLNKNLRDDTKSPQRNGVEFIFISGGSRSLQWKWR